MEVTAIKPRGYCYGVVNALNVVKTALKENPHEQIYIIGIIIHNKFVTEALDRLGVISLYDPKKTKMELVASIETGVVVFSAHGTSEDVVNHAKSKNLIVYNAVCKDVVKTQDIAKEYLDKGYDVLYIGKKSHPESEAMLSIDDRITLINDLTDLDNLTVNDQTIVTNQTTMSLYDTKVLMDALLEKNPNIKIINEICRATQMRQEALFDLSKYDLLYVVGDQLSNNSNNLAKVARQSLDRVQFIESVQDINDEDLKNVNHVAVTSGASTPTSITQQVIDYLSDYPNVNENSRIIDYSKIL